MAEQNKWEGGRFNKTGRGRNTRRRARIQEETLAHELSETDLPESAVIDKKAENELNRLLHRRN